MLKKGGGGGMLGMLREWVEGEGCEDNENSP